MMAAQRRLIPELLKSAEAASLQTAVQNQGMPMLNTILYQFVYGQMEPTRREILLQVIKFYMMKGAFGPQFASPHFLNVPPPQRQGHPAESPTSPTVNKATLNVSPIPGRDRIPSPQEIALHTQQIMQNALIKRKLEEQKENFRRRQEADHMRKGTDSPSNHFAFTPTVVMKKMAADRRDSDPKPMIPELKVSTSAVNIQDKHRNVSPLGGAGGGISPRSMNPPNLLGGPMVPPHAGAGPVAAAAAAAQAAAQQQQQLLFMQQQIRAQQLAAIQQVTPFFSLKHFQIICLKRDTETGPIRTL
jgi:hypothetical protein